MRAETSSVRDLPEMHLMGHTCATLNGELVFVWGGTNEKVAYLTTKNTHLWIYDTLTGYWRKRHCSGECPPYLSCSTSSLIGQKMYVFGGYWTVQDDWLNCLYCLNLETFEWTDLGSRATGVPTKPIRSDKCVSWTYNKRFYVFGGYGWSQTEHYVQLLDIQKDFQLTPDERWPKFGWNNQLVEYNPLDKTWRWPTYAGKCPSARAAHSGALLGNKYYIFGGRDSYERLNDLYSLDMDKLEWTHITNFKLDSASMLGMELASTSRARPISHLLDSGEASENESDDLQVDEQVAAEERHRLQVNDILEEMRQDNSVLDVEDDLSPTPSSSTIRPQSRPHINTYEALEEENGSEDDDNDDEPIEPPHPSLLIERLSMSSSHQSDIEDNMETQQCFSDCTIDQSEHYRRDQPTYSRASSADNRQEDEVVEDDTQRSPSSNGRPAEEKADSSNIQIVPKAPARPAGRSFTSFSAISEKQIILFGGIDSDDQKLDDCWLYDVEQNNWNQVELRNKRPRLWHTGARSRYNEVIIIGGASTDKICDYCSEVVTLSIEPKPLKKIALDAVSRSLRMRSIARVHGLPSTIYKQIKLRKQAIVLTMRGNQ